MAARYDYDEDMVEALRNHDPAQSKNAHWDRNIEIHMARRNGATIDELCELFNLSDQRVKQILHAVEAKVRAGQIR